MSAFENMYRGCRTCLFMLVVMLGWASVSAADIYVWEDESGVMHFTDRPKHTNYQSYLFKSPKASAVADWTRPRIVAEIQRLSGRHGIDPRLVEQVVRAESSFDPLAVSHKGAMGLMQLMPETAKLLGVWEPFDPVQNLDGGIRYLRYLLDRFQWKLDWALAAYHAGETRVARYRGIPPIESTRLYVEKILAGYSGQ